MCDCPAADGAAASDAGAASLTALGKRALGNWTTLLARVPALASGRVPVDGSGVTQPISAAALPLPAGAATAAAQGTGNASLASIDGKVPALVSGRTPVDGSGVTQPVSATALPLPAGAATAAKQDTGNASLASLDGKLPAKGQAAMAASMPVAIASDQGAVKTDGVVQATAISRSGTITAGGTAQQIMAANAGRRGFTIQNQSAGDLYINGLTGATADQNSLKIPTGALYETPVHHVGTGAVSIIGATTGQAFYAREF